ncbi:DGQHR domain-containing protein [Phaeobacter inhibens]|uniref:DGQHR domain-containing protein n=1 Tax=Phaeobacter inhibens TaxID=221822 RepID=UPI0021A31280|nr:DGQHR domain-containing protein [Phaeobacter inhibens]UWR43628.1 DGQHR domain-containing protein [Phaeobacter inhibens]
MAKNPKVAIEDDTVSERLRYSVSLVKQGRHQFYTLTIPSDILAETCVVTTRKEDPKKGFQRELDKKRAMEIARYIDDELGTIPSSIVLSAQSAADLQIVGRGKTLEFTKRKDAFLILDGQHRVYGFSMAKTALRVPVVIYNGLSRRDETRLFIDINTKQKPVPSQLLLDIKQLADVETEAEEILRDVFDTFDEERNSAMAGLLSPAEASRTKITRVTFNQAVKPLLPLFASRSESEIYDILNAYLMAVTAEITKKTPSPLLAKPVVFRAFLALFRPVVQRLVDKYDQAYTSENFQTILGPVFSNLPIAKLEKPGSSWTTLRDYLEKRVVAKLTL